MRTSMACTSHYSQKTPLTKITPRAIRDRLARGRGPVSRTHTRVNDVRRRPSSTSRQDRRRLHRQGRQRQVHDDLAPARQQVRRRRRERERKERCTHPETALRWIFLGEVSTGERRSRSVRGAQNRKKRFFLRRSTSRSPTRVDGANHERARWGGGSGRGAQRSRVFWERRPLGSSARLGWSSRT